MDSEHIRQLCKLIRYYILTMSTGAGSGHPTSSLSAVELMASLMFGDHFHYDIQHPTHPNRDRLIFSKGHASPLFYALWTVAGAISADELMDYRKFDSVLEGHPTKRFIHTEVATGSLGQGLSVGVGMALNGKYLDKLPYKTYVLLGDSEMAEGSNWEAIQLAAHYKLGNLIGIIDVNRLGQRGETMLGHDLGAYKNRIEAFGWNAFTVDGHSIEQISDIYQNAQASEMPTMIIAKTTKGKGVSFLEDKENWHGKALSKEELDRALGEIGGVALQTRAQLRKPADKKPYHVSATEMIETDSSYTDPLATRKAYGHALVEAYPHYPTMVVLDAEVSNSTYAETFKKAHPDRFFEMFIAEQNMVGVGLGLSLSGKIPFISTFASFFTRAVDQIRVAQYSQANVNFVGSHAGVSIGEDGPTQMGLEDIALFRSILDSVVVYPADHVSDEKLVVAMLQHPGICYMRTTRADTEPIYNPDEEFIIGGSKTLKHSQNDRVTVIAAGITLYEALKAHALLSKEHIMIRVIDLYSIKPLDEETLHRAASETKALITVEDHFAQGGIGEAVMSALADHPTPIHSLAVRKMPHSGKPQELLEYEEISATAIVAKVKEML